MEAENIGVGIHYEPVHTQPFFTERFGRNDGELPKRHLHRRAHHLVASERGNVESDVDDVCAALARILRYYAA